jgi:geranylgeranyl pyrophosphate synthase
MFADFQEYAADVKPALDAAFDQRLVLLLGETAPRPIDAAGSCLAGGKKIRGLLLCLVTATLGGSLEAALPRAVAVELIQSATLVHDDFVDQHKSRRNQPALWTLAGARRAVLLGDVIFSSAIHMMSDLGREDCGIVSGAIADLARGAWHEPLDAAALLEACGGRGGKPAGYERIIALKTGILFAAACELGAVAAGAPVSLQRRWRRYGQYIGEAYQVADDLQEMTRALNRETLSGDELADLVPALLFFVPQSRALVRRGLLGGTRVSVPELAPHLRRAAEVMAADRQRRLRAAVAELEGVVPEGPLGRLVRRAPADLLGMFDAEIFPAAGMPCSGAFK